MSWKILAPQAHFSKQVKNAVFGQFLKNLRFFGALFPAKHVYIGAQGA